MAIKLPSSASLVMVGGFETFICAVPLKPYKALEGTHWQADQQARCRKA